MAENLKEVKLKKIIKSAVYEALEDFAFGKAMEEGERTGKVSENEIMRILQKKEYAHRV
ncbi:MAG: hypothetical protein PHF84_04790 [bacterium]|nr:hypothetical protein [bacterium]